MTYYHIPDQVENFEFIDNKSIVENEIITNADSTINTGLHILARIIARDITKNDRDHCQTCIS
jgi:hypothetical protein